MVATNEWSDSVKFILLGCSFFRRNGINWLPDIKHYYHTFRITNNAICYIYRKLYFVIDPPVPVAVYPLNGEFGTRDLGPHQNPPGIAYDIQLATGPFGQPNGSYWFSGKSSSYIEFPNNGKLDTRYSVTLLAWVFPENTDGPIANYGTDYVGVHFWIVNSKVFARLVRRSGEYAAVILTNSLKHSAWNFIGFSYDYDFGIQKLWSEGKVYDVANAGKFELRSQDAIRMGVMDGDQRFFKGRVSCLQVYNRALTEREVQAIRGLCFQKGWCSLL